VGKRFPNGYAISRNGLAPIRHVRIGPDGQWSESYASAAGVDGSPAARIKAALGGVQAAVWFLVKVVVVVIAAFFILIFAAASVAAMFAHGGAFPIGR
jgi:hypothetical protein